LKTVGMIALGIVTLGLAGPANAQGANVGPQGGWYVGLGLGPAWLKSEFRFLGGSSVSPESDTSFFINGAVGYKWDGWRFEVEPYYTDTNTSRSKVIGPLAVNPLIVGGAPASATVDIKGDVGVGGALFNAAYDFPIDDHFSFTLGGGLGWAGVSTKETVSNQLALIDGDKSAFAWQVILGFIYAVNRNFEFQVDYRYNGISDTDHDSPFLAVNPLIVGGAPVHAVTQHGTDLQAVVFSVRWYP